MSVILASYNREFAAVTNRVVALRFRQSHCALLCIAIPPIHKEISSPGEKRDAHIIIIPVEMSKKMQMSCPKEYEGF